MTTWFMDDPKQQYTFYLVAIGTVVFFRCQLSFHFLQNLLDECRLGECAASISCVISVPNELQSAL